jgi:hypothetical protein
MADTIASELSVGQAVTQEDLLWLEMGNSAIKNMLSSYDEPAKQLINITGVLQGLYFVAISFSTLNDQISLKCLQDYAFNTIFIFPVIFWIVSLYFAIRVLMPKFRSRISNLSSSEIQARWEEDRDYKSRNLIWAQRFLVWGFIPLIVSICCYLIFFHSSSSATNILK